VSKAGPSHYVTTGELALTPKKRCSMQNYLRNKLRTQSISVVLLCTCITHCFNTRRHKLPLTPPSILLGFFHLLLLARRFIQEEGPLHPNLTQISCGTKSDFLQCHLVRKTQILSGTRSLRGLLISKGEMGKGKTEEGSPFVVWGSNPFVNRRFLNPSLSGTRRYQR
jgi:hypothetical protein